MQASIKRVRESTVCSTRVDLEVLGHPLPVHEECGLVLIKVQEHAQRVCAHVTHAHGVSTGPERDVAVRHCTHAHMGTLEASGREPFSFQ
jgi:hypothetical protein